MLRCQPILRCARACVFAYDRRWAEMRAYLERQMKEKERVKAANKLEARQERVGHPVATLPTGSEIDGEEEAYVKMALKHALDGQVRVSVGFDRPARVYRRDVTCDATGRVRLPVGTGTLHVGAHLAALYHVAPPSHS